MDEVAIIGISAADQTYDTKNIDLHTYLYEITNNLLNETGIDIGDIDEIVCTGVDPLIGISIFNAQLTSAAGVGAKKLKGNGAITEDALLAIMWCYSLITSGDKDLVMLISINKASECRGSLHKIFNYYFDPLYTRPLGLTDFTGFAIFSQIYMSKYGVKEEDAAEVIAKNRMNGVDNPLVYHKSKVSVDEILNSKYVYYPLKEMEIPTIVDGGGAVLFASRDAARKITNIPIWIMGFGLSTDPYYLPDREYGGCKALREAANMAYKMAKIENPKKQIDLAEVFDITPYYEMITYEELGLCNKGEGAKLVREGVTYREGELPVNTSGGVICGYTIYSNGIYRIMEAYQQLSGNAGARQKEDVETVLVHSVSPICGQRQCVVILRR